MAFDQSKPFYPLMVQYIAMLEGLRHLSPPARSDLEALELPSSIGAPVKLPAVMIATGSFEISIHLKTTLMLAGTILRQARELCEELGVFNPTTEPLWDFLRHCGNAAAHGGKFTFNTREPLRLAEWRGLAIQPSPKGKDNPLYGTPLFAGQAPGFLGLGDPVILLSDIEQAFL